MIDIDKVKEYANKYINEDYTQVQILDVGYAFHIYKQPIQPGPGPTVVLKDTGEVYNFSSNPDDYSIYDASTIDSFKEKLEARGYSTEPVANIS